MRHPGIERRSRHLFWLVLGFLLSPVCFCYRGIGMFHICVSRFLFGRRSYLYIVWRFLRCCSRFWLLLALGIFICFVLVSIALQFPCLLYHPYGLLVSEIYEALLYTVLVLFLCISRIFSLVLVFVVFCSSIPSVTSTRWWVWSLLCSLSSSRRLATKGTSN